MTVRMARFALGSSDLLTSRAESESLPASPRCRMVCGESRGGSADRGRRNCLRRQREHSEPRGWRQATILLYFHDIRTHLGLMFLLATQLHLHWKATLSQNTRVR